MRTIATLRSVCDIEAVVDGVVEQFSQLTSKMTKNWRIIASNFGVEVRFLRATHGKRKKFRSKKKRSYRFSRSGCLRALAQLAGGGACVLRDEPGKISWAAKAKVLRDLAHGARAGAE